MLYECLTGQPAVAGEDGPPKPTDIDPAIPVGFDEVIARGMAENPDDRYQTARELSAAAHNALTAVAAPAPGAVSTTAVEFGRYRLFDKLGQGSMGAVYRAHDTALDRDVAVKLLQPELAAEPGFQERFRREAYGAGRLANPNIIPIYETGEIDGRLYFVMPIIDGVDLNKVLKRDGPMSPQKAVRVVEQVAAALDAAHKSGLVHRDVKPSNLLMVGEDFVYLIDFGLVHEADAGRLTLTNVAPGSPAYMAPERFGSGKNVDARADVYSLACVLYECLTGRLPFSGGGVEGLAAAHRGDEPPKPSSFNPAIPVAFDAVIARGMAKEPEDRFQSAHELAVAARAALTDVSGAAPPGPGADRRPRRRRLGGGHRAGDPVLTTQPAKKTWPRCSDRRRAGGGRGHRRLARSCGSPTNSRSIRRNRRVRSCWRSPVWTTPKRSRSMRRATSTSPTAATTGCWNWPRARPPRPWYRWPAWTVPPI